MWLSTGARAGMVVPSSAEGVPFSSMYSATGEATSMLYRFKRLLLSYRSQIHAQIPTLGDVGAKQ